MKKGKPLTLFYSMQLFFLLKNLKKHPGEKKLTWKSAHHANLFTSIRIQTLSNKDFRVGKNKKRKNETSSW